MHRVGARRLTNNAQHTGHHALEKSSDNLLAYHDTEPYSDRVPSPVLVQGWGVGGKHFDAKVSALFPHFVFVVPGLAASDWHVQNPADLVNFNETPAQCSTNPDRKPNRVAELKL